MFNFHPTHSQTGLFVPVPENGDYQVVLSTDDKVFGGYQNIDKTVIYHTWAHDPQMGDGFVIYLPARTRLCCARSRKEGLTNTARRGKLSITRSLLGLVGEAAFIEATESGESRWANRGVIAGRGSISADRRSPSSLPKTKSGNSRPPFPIYRRRPSRLADSPSER
ncbi:MAG: alpha amylase C-terminal domain-containing protein [Oscillospiraceae bacterium]